MKQVVTVVDFCSSKVVCAIGECDSEGNIEVIGAGVVPYDGIRRFGWQNWQMVPAAVEEAIVQAEEQAHRKVREVSVGIPGPFITTLTRDAQVHIQSRDGRVEQGHIRDIMEQCEDFFIPEVSRIIHVGPVAYELDGKLARGNPVGMRAAVMNGKVGYVMANTVFLQDIQQLFKILNLSVGAFASTNYAQAMYVIPREQRGELCILLDVGHFETDVDIVCGDGVVYHGIINVGGMNFTNDISQVLHISMEDAEQLKRRFVFGLDDFSGYDMIKMSDGRLYTFEHSLVQEVVDARAFEIVTLVQEAVKAADMPLTSATRVYFTGGGMALMRGSREFMEKHLEMHVHTCEPKTAKLAQVNYVSTLALLDYIFREDDNSARSGGIMGRFMNFLGIE